MLLQPSSSGLDPAGLLVVNQPLYSDIYDDSSFSLIYVAGRFLNVLS